MIIKFKARKLQKTTTSFVLPIPPVWVTTLGLGKGSVLNCEMLEDNSLRIIPN
jgi:hypothetical protein